MKKLIIACEILILSVFLAKVIAVGGFINSSEIADRYLSIDKASADSPIVNEHTMKSNESRDGLSEERELVALLLKKQRELEEREHHLKTEGKRLSSLKNEILSKIEKLREMEDKLSGLLETINEIDDMRYKNLAKVYESTPPAQASSMLEKLDKKTAAAIIMNMKSKSAGAVWGHMSPQKAVEITKEITAARLFSDENSQY